MKNICVQAFADTLSKATNLAKLLDLPVLLPNDAPPASGEYYSLQVLPKRLQMAHFEPSSFVFYFFFKLLHKPYWLNMQARVGPKKNLHGIVIL